MACDGKARLVDGARMAQQQVAVIHRQRQRPARLQLAGNQIVDISHHGLQRRHRQMHIGEALFVHAVSREERLVELEQRHRSRPHREFAAAMGDAGFAAAGVARQAIAVVIGRQHLALFAPHGGEGAVAAAEHGGADMDRIHRGAKRHVLGRIEFAGVGEMLEQLGENHEALPLAQALRQHVGRQHFRENGHRREILVAGGTVWPPPDERRLKARQT